VRWVRGAAEGTTQDRSDLGRLREWWEDLTLFGLPTWHLFFFPTPSRPSARLFDLFTVPSRRRNRSVAEYTVVSSSTLSPAPGPKPRLPESQLSFPVNCVTHHSSVSPVQLATFSLSSEEKRKSL
jgi:hypothetical protein